MAYLTKYNYGKLCKKLAINKEVSLEFFQQYIFEDKEIFYLLNKRELEYLFTYKMLITNEKEFFLEHYRVVPEEKDSKTRVFNRGGKIKYHLSSGCESFSKDYIDFKIPQDIIDISKNDSSVIEEYRDWFKNENFKEKLSKQLIAKEQINRQFNLKYPKKYGIEAIEENSNLLLIEAKNSKHNFLNREFDLDKFKKELLEAKEQWKNKYSM